MAGIGGERDVPVFPVVLAAPRTFHLFVRDDADHWQPSLDDINDGTYDALKLKRVSFYLDVGLPHGNVMGFGFDGSLILPRNPHLRSADDALDEFNKAVATCLLGGLAGDQVTLQELAFGCLRGTGYFRYEQTNGSTAELHRALGEGATGNLLAIQLLDPLRVTKSDVEEAFTAGSPVIAAIERVNPATLVMAFSYHRSTEYRNSLIYSWVVIEQLIEQLWEEAFLGDPKQLLFPERDRAIAANARTASGKIEFMTQGGLIGRHLYQSLSRARSARNKFVHQGKSPYRRSSYVALMALSQLIEKLCSQRGVQFDVTRLSRLLARSFRAAPQEMIAEAKDADWSSLRGWWREVKPIPGEPRFEGEYETFRDTQLDPRSPVTD